MKFSLTASSLIVSTLTAAEPLGSDPITKESIIEALLKVPKNELRETLDKGLGSLKADESNCTKYRTSYECCADAQCKFCNYGLLVEVIARAKIQPQLIDYTKQPLYWSGQVCSSCLTLLPPLIKAAMQKALNMTADAVDDLINKYDLLPAKTYEPGTCPDEFASLPPMPSQPPRYSGAMRQSVWAVGVASLTLAVI